MTSKTNTYDIAITLPNGYSGFLYCQYYVRYTGRTEINTNAPQYEVRQFTPPCGPF